MPVVYEAGQRGSISQQEDRGDGPSIRHFLPTLCIPAVFHSSGNVGGYVHGKSGGRCRKVLGGDQ